jgi:hypothetical protein
MQQTLGYKVLASAGNQAVYGAAGGVPVYADPSNPFKKARVLVPAGNYVFFNPDTNTTLSIAQIPTVDRIAIGVGVGPYVNGPSESLRLTSYDFVELCNINRANAEPPRCAQAPKVRVLYECVDCHDDVAIKVRWRNNNTEQNLSENQWDEFTHFAKETCAACGGCSPVDVSDAVSCKLVQSGEDQPYKYGKEGSWGYLKKPSRPYTMRRIRTGEITYQYCLNPVANACAECVVVPAITGFTYDAGAGPQQVLFNGTTNPSNPTQTYLEQVNWVIDQINAVIAAWGGKASKETGAEKNTCCPEKLNISSCYPITLLGDQQVVIPTCAVVNPNLTAPFSAQCRDCTVPANTRTYVAGVEIEFHLDPNECSCHTNILGKMSYAIEYDIEVFGIPKGSYQIVEDQAVIVPENFGFQWIVKEFGQETGGLGREEAYYNSYDQWFGQPMKDSKQEALMSQCRTPYCSFHLDHSVELSNISVSGDSYKPRWGSIFLVPSTDTVALASFQDHFNAMLTSRNCPVKTQVRCWDGNAIIDDDQIEPGLNVSGRKYGE